MVSSSSNPYLWQWREQIFAQCLHVNRLPDWMFSVRFSWRRIWLDLWGLNILCRLRQLFPSLCYLLESRQPCDSNERDLCPNIKMSNWGFKKKWVCCFLINEDRFELQCCVDHHREDAQGKTAKRSHDLSGKIKGLALQHKGIQLHYSASNWMFTITITNIKHKKIHWKSASVLPLFWLAELWQDLKKPLNFLHQK